MTTVHQVTGDLLDMVARTEGFTVHQNGNSIKITNDGSRRTLTVSSTPQHSRTLANMKTRLKNRVGWTEALYKAQQERERAQRMARADEQFKEQYGRLLQQAEAAVQAVVPTALPDGLTMTGEVITPEMALEYVLAAENPPPGRRQRPESPRDIANYARQMTEGKWRLTHQGIAFALNPDGSQWLFDGQNRMRACMEAGVPIPMVVWRGADPDTFNVLDAGKKRSIGDMLYAKQETNGALLGSTLRLLYLWENVPQDEWGSTVVDPDDIEATLAKHPRVRESATVGNRLKKVKISPTAAAVGDFLIRQAWPDAPIEEFFDHFASGANCGEKAPVLVLRNYLMNQSSRRHSYNASKTGPKNVFHLYLLMQAWNNTCQHRPMRNITWRLPIRVPDPYRPGM